MGFRLSIFLNLEFSQNRPTHPPGNLRPDRRMGGPSANNTQSNGGTASSNHNPPATNGGDASPNQPPPLATNQAITESDPSKKRKMGMLPLEVGTRVLCRWRDGKLHPVKVIERRRIHNGGQNDYEYYVHYTECTSFLTLFTKFFEFSRVYVFGS